MNDPLTKYGGLIEEPLSFFNYHEFLTDTYGSSGDNLSSYQKQHDSGSSSATDPTHHRISLVINHFPNVHATKDSALYQTTRIVRIPRSFETHDLLYMIPQFSRYTPGNEPAAITSDPSDPGVLGYFDGTAFGSSSSTPLVPTYLSAVELDSIVESVNKLISEAFSPNPTTSLENFFDLISATLYSRVLGGRSEGSHLKRMIARMEHYVTDINNNLLQKRHGLLRLISPVDTAFLSLDFQIPKRLGYDKFHSDDCTVDK